jgi:hypothetical protein
VKFFAALRYLLFAAVGAVIAAAFFVLLNLLVSANFDASTSFIERWIVRATCDNYALSGTIRDSAGTPVAFAVIEASYLDERLTTRSGGDGRFRLIADDALCEGRPRTVAVLVVADDYRPKRQVVRFEETTLDFILDRRDL